MALVLAIELDKTQTDQLLKAAGYSLSGSDTFDLITRFFLEKEICDIAHTNEALDYFSLNPMVGVEEKDLSHGIKGSAFA